MNTAKSPEIDLHKCIQLIFNKEQKQYNEENITFPKNGGRMIGHAMQKEK
jgi:hypothetical protein